MMISLIAYKSTAQHDRTITSVNLQFNNTYQFNSSKSNVNSFYGLGGQVSVFLKDKVYLGYSQMGSVAPTDLSKDNNLSPNKIQMNEYTLNAGIKSALSTNIYLLAGFRGGMGIISLGSVQKVDGFNEFLSKETGQFYLVAPELKLGLQINKYFALETGTSYRKYFGSEAKWQVSPQDFNGFEASISIVGRIPFK